MTQRNDGKQVKPIPYHLLDRSMSITLDCPTCKTLHLPNGYMLHIDAIASWKGDDVIVVDSEHNIYHNPLYVELSSIWIGIINHRKVSLPENPRHTMHALLTYCEAELHLVWITFWQRKGETYIYAVPAKRYSKS